MHHHSKKLCYVIYVDNTMTKIYYSNIQKYVLIISKIKRQESIPFEETFLLLKQLNHLDELLPQEKLQYNETALDIFIKFQIISCEFCQASIVRSSLTDHQLVCEKRKFFLIKTIESSQKNMERLYLEQQILDNQIKSQLDYLKEEPKECYGIPQKNAYASRDERPIKPLSKNLSQELFGGRVPETKQTLNTCQSEQNIRQPLISFANHNFDVKNEYQKKQMLKKKKNNLKKNTKQKPKKKQACKLDKSLQKYYSTGTHNKPSKIKNQNLDLKKYNSTGTQKNKKVVCQNQIDNNNLKSFSKQDTSSTQKKHQYKKQKTQSDNSQKNKSLSINKKLRENQSVLIPQHFHEKIASKMNKIEESIRDIENFKNNQQETRENVYNQILAKMTVTPKNKLDLMRFQSKQRRLSSYQSSPQLIQLIQK